MALTHYVPLEYARPRGLQRTVCGLAVDGRDHSVEPTCPACQRLLVEDDLAREATLRALAAEFPEDADRLLAGVKA